MIEKLIELVKAVKGLHWYTIIALFVGSVLYSFNHEIVRLIEMEWSESDLVVDSLNNDITIDESLADLLTEHKASRAWIIRFHNGVKYYNGTHKSKMSCDYEVVSEGVSTEAQGFQDVPTGLYSRWIKDIVELEMFFCNVKTMTDLRIKHLLKTQGVQAMAVAPYYRNGKLFALIGIDYTMRTTESSCKKFCANKDAQILRFKSKTDRIGDLLI